MSKVHTQGSGGHCVQKVKGYAYDLALDLLN